MTRFFLKFLLLFLLISAVKPATAQTNQWRPVSGARQDNISGMALLSRDAQKTAFVIVNDNKKREQNHIAIVTVAGKQPPKYTPLKWIGDDVPLDLEAVCRVPGAKNDFIALSSAGKVFHFEINLRENSAKLIKSFDVPQIPAKSDYEGFAVQKIGKTVFAVWADRGLDEKPAQLFWSKFDLNADAFTGETYSTFLRVPYPAGNTRHISDLKIDESGAIFISSAADPGNDGPFASAVYFAGTFSFCDSPVISFTPSSALVRLFRFDYRKVEAIELVPGANGGMVFGTDDEDLGSAIYLDW